VYILATVSLTAQTNNIIDCELLTCGSIIVESRLDNGGNLIITGEGINAFNNDGTLRFQIGRTPPSQEDSIIIYGDESYLEIFSNTLSIFEKKALVPSVRLHSIKKSPALFLIGDTLMSSFTPKGITIRKDGGETVTLPK
jgi:hypothetical protein